MDDSRSNFASFDIGMLTIFQLLTGDSWSGVLYSAMGSKITTFSQIFAGVFICTWFIFSRLIVYNLFVAVIIENFQVWPSIRILMLLGLAKVDLSFPPVSIELFFFFRCRCIYFVFLLRLRKVISHSADHLCIYFVFFDCTQIGRPVCRLRMNMPCFFVVCT